MTVMTARLKTFAAALVLAFAGANANAALVNTDHPGNQPTPGAGDGTGGLFFSMWDPVRVQSFYMNLLENANQFRANPFVSRTITGEKITALGTWIGGAPDKTQLVWNIGALSNAPPQGGPDYGGLSTARDPSPFLTTGVFSGLEGSINSTGRIYVDSNNRWDSADPDSIPDLELADHHIVDVVNDAYHGTNWGNSWGGQLGIDSHAFINDSNGFYYFFADQSAPFFAGAFTHLGGGRWHLNFDDLSNTAGLRFQPIPVPAALWLMGSALLAMVGISRRRGA